MSRRFIIIIFIGCLSFCSSGLKNLDQQIKILKDDLSEVRKTNSSFLKYLQDIDNRLLLIEDEIDTLKIARQQKHSKNLDIVQETMDMQIPSDLPVIRLQPEQENIQTMKADIDSLPDENHTIEFAQNFFQEIDDNGNILDKNKDKKIKKSFSMKKDKAPNKMDILEEYNRAYALYQQRNYFSALEAFKEFAVKYPLHPYADNSLYWAGECHYDIKEYDQAIVEFKKILQRYPDGNKVPDAMLKVGLTYAILGMETESQKELNALIQAFPASQAGLLALRILSEKQSEKQFKN